jgi:solute carrier family 45 protein 1/2/4
VPQEEFSIPTEKSSATLKQYLRSIVFMPNSLRILCLTNLFCWSAHICYSLYFTDFVGEAVFEGDPKVGFIALL